MHNIEPFYRWREEYAVEDDERSPFYGETYGAPRQIYNYIIHPLWDDFGSNTLYVKILFADYETNCVVIEMLGEWNDAVENDIMELKRHVIEPLLDEGISKFILILDNVLNFHGSDDEYYAEWAEECRDAFNGGWIALLDTFDHVADEMHGLQLDNYMSFGQDFNGINWRQYPPQYLLQSVENLMRGGRKRVG